jgi:hypothetical protein
MPIAAACWIIFRPPGRDSKLLPDLEGIRFATPTLEVQKMPDEQLDDLTVVPIPASESDAEHVRIKKSNDRDQELEREGRVSRHNRGYDEAVKGVPQPEIARLVDEE